MGFYAEWKIDLGNMHREIGIMSGNQTDKRSFYFDIDMNI